MTTLLAFAMTLALVTSEGALGFDKAEIPHLDGTGRSTIVEVEPGVPGRQRFLDAMPEPIPSPGEVLLPARRSLEPTPRPR